MGFTTSESEQVVNHPVRRKIILHLIIAGNIGFTSALATLLVTLMRSDDRGLGMTFAWLGIAVLGLLVLGLFLNLRVVSDPVDHFIRVTLEKAGMTKVIDFDYLLNLRDGFCVYDGEIHEKHPWIGKALWQIKPADVVIIVLGIYRSGGEFVGAPQKDTEIQSEDVLMV